MAPKLALFLRQYRTERERRYAELMKHLTPDDLVFTNIEGKPIIEQNTLVGTGYLNR